MVLKSIRILISIGILNQLQKLLIAVKHEKSRDSCTVYVTDPVLIIVFSEVVPLRPKLKLEVEPKLLS